jgi:hypothetical protein
MDIRGFSKVKIATYIELECKVKESEMEKDFFPDAI